MVEPSDELQAVFENAIETAKKLHHEYLTIEHLLFSMLGDEPFANTIQSYGAKPGELRNNLGIYLQTKCSEITIQDVVVKPKKTQSVERILNRAFTRNRRYQLHHLLCLELLCHRPIVYLLR